MYSEASTPSTNVLKPRTFFSLQGCLHVNVAIDVDSFLEIIRFFATLILNADEAVTL